VLAFTQFQQKLGWGDEERIFLKDPTDDDNRMGAQNVQTGVGQ
jgi:hypothetical protein